MRVTVCEFPDEDEHKERAWAALKSYLQAEPTDVLVLPEMPFADWKLFMSCEVDTTKWRRLLERHGAFEERFAELNAGIVLSSRPSQQGEKRLNEAFAWDRRKGCQGVRAKHYLPDEPDGWEAIWFDQGELDFSPSVMGGLSVGFQICTEMLLSDVSMTIGRAGGNFIAAPRATGDHDRWLLSARMAAIMSGCFVASANRRSVDTTAWPGEAWLISPEGEVLARTTTEQPVASAQINLDEVNAAKQSYPRNVFL